MAHTPEDPPVVVSNNNRGLYGTGDVVRDTTALNADRAEVAAANAEVSATEAAASAAAALASEQAAATYETNAAASAVTAATEAGNAATEADAAEASALSAGTSASNAATSETNAAASAAAAAVSEANAAQSAIDAANEVGVLTPRVEALEADTHTHANKSVLDATTASYTTAEETKLAAIEDGATADQSAAEVPYNNTTSGLTATDIQAAIDEVVATPGGVNWAGNTKTTSFTAAAANGYLVSGAGITATLPASPEDGDVVIFTDLVGDWDTNVVTVAGNGSTIEGDSTLLLDYRGGSVELVYSGTTTNWEVRISGAGPQAVVEERFPAGQATYTLASAPGNETAIDVYVGNVFQNTEAYTLSGTSLQFGAATTDEVTVRHTGFAVFGDATLNVSIFTGDGVKTDFDLGVTPSSANNILVTVDAVPQSTTAYGFSGTILQFTEAPVNGAKIESRVIAQAGANVVPEDASVTTAKLANLAVTEEKLSADLKERIASAWAFFSFVGGVPTLNESNNVSSLTDSGVGQTIVNYSSPLPTATYAVSVTGDGDVAWSGFTRQTPFPRSATQCYIGFYDGTPSFADPNSADFIAM